MEFFTFILATFAFFISLTLARENPTWWRKTIFTFFTLILGAGIFFTGVAWPNGYSITTVGSTTTQTLTYITYLAATKGTNSVPFLYGIGAILLLYGIFGLIFTFTDMYSEILKFSKGELKIAWKWN